MIMHKKFNEENYQNILKSLGFTEEMNYISGKIEVYNDDGVLIWRYSSIEEKERVHYFLLGIAYWKALMKISNRGEE